MIDVTQLRALYEARQAGVAAFINGELEEFPIGPSIALYDALLAALPELLEAEQRAQETAAALGASIMLLALVKLGHGRFLNGKPLWRHEVTPA
jgi:hypothetical protein